jgi:hypothetical protein
MHEILVEGAGVFIATCQEQIHFIMPKHRIVPVASLNIASRYVLKTYHFAALAINNHFVRYFPENQFHYHPKFAVM